MAYIISEYVNRLKKRTDKKKLTNMLTGSQKDLYLSKNKMQN